MKESVYNHDGYEAPGQSAQGGFFVVTCVLVSYVMEGTLMKKRLLALLLVLVLLIPAGVASAATRYRVNTGSLKVRQMPSESAAVLASYRLDYVLTVQSSKDGWSYVKFTNG